MDKTDIYVVAVPATENAYNGLHALASTVWTIAQDVDEETALNVGDTVAQLWDDIPDSAD